MQELKPCPFCGASLVFKQARVVDDYHEHPRNVPCILAGDHLIRDPFTLFDDAEAAAAWNRRAHVGASRPCDRCGTPDLCAKLGCASAAMDREAADAAGVKGTSEVERLRAEQAAGVMPQIGPLLDAWDGMDNDTKAVLREDAPDLARALSAISRAMDGTDGVMVDGLTHLHVRTRHPQDYVLHNEQDGTRWRGTADGRWVRDVGVAAPAPSIDPENQFIGDLMILQVLADSEQVNDQEREVLLRWIELAQPPGVKVDAPTLREAVDFLMEVQDEGPSGQGWKSKRLLDLIARLENAAGVPPSHEAQQKGGA